MHLGREVLVRYLEDADIRHLAECYRCRDRLASLFLDTAMPGILPHPVERSDEESLFLLALNVRGEKDRALEADREQAGPLLDQLLAMTDGSVDTAVEADHRFHSIGLANLLLNASAEAPDPNRALRLARLSLLVLDQLQESPHYNPHRALAHCLLAEARRRRGELDIADEFFKEAANQLVDEPLFISARISFSRLLGLLRADQRRVDEAFALLGRAQVLAESSGEHLQLALSLLSQGWLLLDEYEHYPAVLAFRQASALLAEAQADLLFAALSGLALASAELGHSAVLEEAMRELKPIVRQVPDGKDRLRLLRARLARIAGDTREATQRFHGLFLAQVQRAQAVEAALTALELTQLLLESPPPEGEPRILALRDQLRPFAAAGTLPEHLWQVTSFGLAVASERRGAYNDVIDSALAYLPRGRFNPELEFYPLPEPEQVLSWDELSDPLKAEVIEAAGLSSGPKSAMDWQHIAWNCEAITGIRLRLAY